MPIKVDLHDNTSQVKVKVCGNDILPVATGEDINYKKLEIIINEEIANRIAGDAHLQEEIDDIRLKAGAYYLSISENNDGSIDISLLAKDETVLDTKTITLTEKIIKSAEVDYNNAKINYTCNDNSVIELDISSIISRIAEAFADLEEIRTEISNINTTVSQQGAAISTLNTIVSSHNTDISLLKTTVNTHTTQISTMNNQISGINTQINTINSNISTMSGQINTLNTTVAGHGVKISTLETAMGEVTISIAALENNKVDKDFVTAEYTHIDPSSLTVDKLDELLVYISKNGAPTYAKLIELGFARIRDYNNAEGMAEVDVGDLLIDMD